MKISPTNVELSKTGVVVVPVPGCTVSGPWHSYVGGVKVAAVSVSALKQESVMTSAVDASPRKDAFARSGIRTEGPPV